VLSRRLIKPYSSISKRAGEGVPYETVLTTESSSEQILPTEADVVVLGTAWHFVNFFFFKLLFYSNNSLQFTGGGSIGCNTLYHLTKLGVKNAVLLERNRLTSGTTWHTGMTKILQLLIVIEAS
jgi:sarcosine dehydrogenase